MLLDCLPHPIRKRGRRNDFSVWTVGEADNRRTDMTEDGRTDMTEDGRTDMTRERRAEEERKGGEEERWRFHTVGDWMKNNISLQEGDLVFECV